MIPRRPSAVIREEIAAAEAVLTRLRAEHVATCSSERMRELQKDPEFQRKRREAQVRALSAPALRAKHLARLRAVSHPELPPMTKRQKAAYRKLRWEHHVPRDEAIKTVLAP